MLQDSYTITIKDALYRRFPTVNEPKYKGFWKIVNGRKIPSSAAFKTKKDEDGLSVNIAVLTTPQLTAIDNEMYGVAEFCAQTPINLGYECQHNRKPENDAHALIVGDTNPIAKKLATSLTQIFYC